MSKLLAFNLTTSPLSLAAGTASPLPASTATGERGEGVNVTAELHNLTQPEYELIQAQVDANLVEIEWDGSPDWETPGLYTIYAGAATEIIRVDYSNSPYYALHGIILVDTSVAPVVVYAPSAKTPGGEFTIRDVGGNSRVNPITVKSTFGDVIEDAVLSSDEATQTWFSDGEGNWLVKAAWLGASSVAIDGATTVVGGGFANATSGTPASGSGGGIVYDGHFGGERSQLATYDNSTHELLYELIQELEMILCVLEG